MKPDLNCILVKLHEASLHLHSTSANPEDSKTVKDFLGPQVNEWKFEQCFFCLFAFSFWYRT